MEKRSKKKERILSNTRKRVEISGGKKKDLCNSMDKDRGKVRQVSLKCAFCKERKHWKTSAKPVKVCGCANSKCHESCLYEWLKEQKSRYCVMCREQYYDVFTKRQLENFLLLSVVFMMILSTMRLATEPLWKSTAASIHESVCSTFFCDVSSPHGGFERAATTLSFLMRSLILVFLGCSKALVSGAWMFILSREVYNRCPWV